MSDPRTIQHVLAVFGTRPEVIKLAPVFHALAARRDSIRLTLCASGQHREMLEQALAAFELTTDLNLDVMTAGQTPTAVLARVVAALGPVIDAQKPDIVMVQGDTITVTGAALAGYLSGVRVAHVEAGLRTGDKRAPFPEEICRRVAGVVADYHFVPTDPARENLLREGVPADTIYLTGNTVIDALLWMRERVLKGQLPADVPLNDGRLVLVTAHRRENFGAPFRSVCEALRELAETEDDIQLIYPVHLNPSVQSVARDVLADCPRVHLITPQPYEAFVNLLVRAHLILTDSGGIQEEVTALGTPTLVFRDKTERPEAVASGIVKLVGTDRDRIIAEARQLLRDPAAYGAMAGVRSVYGDGRAAQRIADVLCTGSMQCEGFVPDVMTASPA